MRVVEVFMELNTNFHDVE